MAMAGKDEGEFELILGNRQIVSVLFIVVVLMGVFFAMGFLAGRSTSPQAAATPGRTSTQAPISVDAGGAAQGEPAGRKSEPAAVEPAPTQPAASATPPGAAPAQRPSQLFIDQPPPGTYLQAAATQRADAEAMLGYLGGKTGLRGYVTPAPKSPELCRVLIGPLADNEEIAAARSKLLSLGVKNAYIVKY